MLLTATRSAQAAAAGLAVQAEAKGLYYGAAVSAEHLQEQAFGDAVVRECDVVVPENALKWGATESRRGVPNYSDADQIAAFAATNHKRMRGHTLAWYRTTPGWLAAALTEPRGIEVLYSHIDAVVSRFRGRIFEWDVVNEAIEPKDNLDGGLRNTAYYKAGGEAYIAECFARAHAADPDARLVYNEYGLEYDSGNSERRRKATLQLLERLKARGAPVHGLGIQSHIKLGNPIDERRYAAFLRDVAGLGLTIRLTEFDVDDSDLTTAAPYRDAAVASYARQLLDIALDQPAVIGLMSWGLTDRYNWLDSASPRTDGDHHRSLPLDANYNRTPLWNAISQSLAAAPARSPR